MIILGGLGHLGVQYAAKMGFKTVAIARGKDKEPLARQLGAWKYIDSQGQDAAAELQKLGGAKAILATVTDGDAMSAVLGGLGINGTLMAIGAAQSGRQPDDQEPRVASAEAWHRRVVPGRELGAVFEAVADEARAERAILVGLGYLRWVLCRWLLSIRLVDCR